MDTLIIGGGPAGLTAACFCAGKSTVIDRLKTPGRKLLATGGGRCNLTHATDAAGILSVFGRQARFMAPALQAFPPQAIRDFFHRLGVETREEPDGCVFPVSQKAADVLAALERAAQNHGAEIRCGVRAKRLVLEKKAPPSDSAGQTAPALRVTAVETNHGLLHARRVILAAGGQSYPDLGSDGSGFALAREAGLSVVTPVPALAGLVTRETWPTELAGIVLERGGLRLDAKGASKQFITGPILFTHKGLSGPPALALSGEIATRLLTEIGQPPEQVPAVTVRLSFIAERTVADWLTLFEGWRRVHGGRVLHNLLAGELPRALAVTLCTLTALTETAAARARKSSLETLRRRVRGSAVTHRRYGRLGPRHAHARRRSAGRTRSRHARLQADRGAILRGRGCRSRRPLRRLQPDLGLRLWPAGRHFRLNEHRSAGCRPPSNQPEQRAQLSNCLKNKIR